MAYNTSKGPRGLGDIKNEDDVDTQIDWDDDKITFKTNDVARVVIDNDQSVLRFSHLMMRRIFACIT